MGIIVPDIFAEFCSYSRTRSALDIPNGDPGQTKHEEEVDLPVSDDAPGSGEAGGASAENDQQAAALQEMATPVA